MRRPHRGWIAGLALVGALLINGNALAAHRSASGTCPSGTAAVLSPTLTAAQGLTATATFKIATYCSNIEVHLASYDAPAGNFALPQTFIASDPTPTSSTRYSRNNGALYTLHVPVSPCYYQVDLVVGPVITNLTNSTLYGTRKLLAKNGGSPCASKMTTQATSAITIGSGTIGDSAILSGLSSVNMATGGTVTFALFGPDNATCSGNPIFTTTANVNAGSGTYPTASSYTPTAIGTYSWIASYPGSAQNGPANGKCNDANESVKVNPAYPQLATTASPTVTLGNPISDSAALTGGYNPTGSITFKLYGPNDGTCATAAIFTSAAIPVNGNGNYSSGNYTPTHVGTYRWVASYTSNNTKNASASAACNAANESVTVLQAGPRLVTQAAAANIAFHGTTSDTATLSGASSAAHGTITFKLYGPNDATCGNPPVYTSAAIPVNGNGNYGSGTTAPAASGLYHWQATYTGDLDNLGVTLGCNEGGESVQVGDQDKTPPACVLTSRTGSPPTLTITISDGGSGLKSIVVADPHNASVTIPNFNNGTTAPVVVTAHRTDPANGGSFALLVTDVEGLVTRCDPSIRSTAKVVRSNIARPAARATGSAVTLHISRSHMAFGSDAPLQLTGRIAGGAGQTVTLLGQSCGFSSASPVATTKTNAGGLFRFALSPMLTTSFSVRWNSSTSNVLRVAIEPLVALTRESAGRYRIDVSTTNGQFLDGQRVELQRWTGKNWARVTNATLQKNAPDDAMTAVSTGLVAAGVYGSKLRAVVPATACYSGGGSSTIIG